LGKPGCERLLYLGLRRVPVRAWRKPDDEIVCLTGFACQILHHAEGHEQNSKITRQHHTALSADGLPGSDQEVLG
jgi:hypothetical protein